MRRSAWLLALGICVLNGSTANADKGTDGYVAEIDRACRTEWGTDYRMIEYCQDRQREAMAVVLGTQRQVAGNSAREGILSNCQRDWPEGNGYDWAMVAYCYDRQTESMAAILVIQQSANADPTKQEILEACFRDWPSGVGYDWAMVEYCYDQQYAAYQRLDGGVK